MREIVDGVARRAYHDNMGKAAVLLCLSVAAGCGGTASDGPLSCAKLAATCGPTGAASCCDSSVVTGGTSFRSYDVASDGMFSDMTNPATVSDFRLDTYEVTVGRFRAFVNAGMGTQHMPPRTGAGARTLNGTANQGGWDSSWNAMLSADASALTAALKCNPTHQYETWTDAPGANENEPIVCVTWYEAMAFCAWDGGFLPTEAEWNYAAAGGSEQRAFPWSSPASSTTIDCSLANFAPNGVSCVVAGMTDVGATSPSGDSLWGQADLGGNASEWTLDWYSKPYLLPCDDCANLNDSGSRVVRGGGFLDETASGCRGALRSFVTVDPSALGDGRYIDVGMRCARTP